MFMMLPFAVTVAGQANTNDSDVYVAVDDDHEDDDDDDFFRGHNITYNKAVYLLSFGM